MNRKLTQKLVSICRLSCLLRTLHYTRTKLGKKDNGAERGTRTLTPKALAPHASVSTNFTISAS
ncbi:hypothetical protein VDIAB_100063 [Vibrio diabolicus]|nr:hypothetical protein VDIAB_100063 [Vibrio diabolicus]